MCRRSTRKASSFERQDLALSVFISQTARRTLHRLGTTVNKGVVRLQLDRETLYSMQLHFKNLPARLESRDLAIQEQSLE